MTEPNFKLLQADDPPPVTVVRPDAASPFLLVCDHAGNRIPRKLGTLGVSEADLRRHIAWDVGAAEMANRVSELLDAPLVLQTYSRLVIDCNRDPKVESAMPRVGEITEIPGNRDLHPHEAAARIAEIFQPYHDRIAAMMDARAAAGRPDHPGRAAQLHALLRGPGRPALAHRHPLQQGRPPATNHAGVAGRRARAHGRRQRAL